MKKKFFYIALGIIFFLGAVSGFVISIYDQGNVDLLHTHYPVYREEAKDYILIKKRPYNWVSLKDVSDIAKWAILVSEDWAFYDHSGIDTRQLMIVFEESISEGRFTRGASTITQQVVKNVFLSNERSLMRKFKEMLWSFKIESVLSKDQILEIYLNLIELGDCIYGIKDASFYYFKKPPSELTAREGAFLAMLLPSPVKYSISFEKRELTEFAKSQVEKILIKLRQAGRYKEKDRLQALKERFWWEK